MSPALPARPTAVSPKARDRRNHTTRRGILDCFAGVGGFAHALLDPRFGYELALTVELDADARRVYAASFPDHDPARIVGNIRRLTRIHPDGRMPSDAELAAWEQDGMPDGVFADASAGQIRAAIASLGADPDGIAVVCGGPPCQTASKAGRQAGTSDRVRGTLFADVIAVAEAVRAPLLLLENVANLSGERHREWYAQIIAHIRTAGYAIADTPLLLSPDTLRPERMGTPQVRKRLFFAARRIDDGTASADPAAPRTGLDIDALVSLFDWDPARWDPQDICDPDDAFDTTAYLLAPRERAWIGAWNDLVQALPVDDLPTELYVDTFTADWAPSPDLDPAARRRMERSHTFYGKHRAVIDAWAVRTWDIDGTPTRPADFPKTRRILEWQARDSQPTRADRDLWQTTFSFRSSGIRVKNLTTLPALVALNTTSVIGPRGRYITPNEAARLQGMPAPAYSPAIPLRPTAIPTGDEVAAWPDTTWRHPVVRTDADLLAEAARAVTDIWWLHGGYHVDATTVALQAADDAGATPGEILLAAGALAARQPRWRGSGIRWTSLAWDAYAALSPDSPIAYDPVFAAIDWRVRRRATLDAARRAQGGGPAPVPDAALLDWFADHVDIALPSAGRTWADRARDIARAARVHRIDVEWTRALHRCALLCAWDPATRPLSGLAELDDALEHLGVVTYRVHAPAGTSLAAAGLLAAGRPGTRLPTTGSAGSTGPSRHLGTGLPAGALPLTRTSLEDGRARLRQLRDVIEESSRRVTTLQASGESDPRTEQAALAAIEEYVHAAYALRRHRALAGELLTAGRLVSALLTQPGAHDYRTAGLLDAAHGLIEAWARHYTCPPYGPAPVLVLPDRPAAESDLPAEAARLASTPTSLLDRLKRADDAVAHLAPTCGIAGTVVAAHYERERSRAAHVLDLVGLQALTPDEADDLVYATTRVPHLPALLEHLDRVADWTVEHAGAHAYSWDRAVQAHAAGLLEPACREADPISA